MKMPGMNEKGQTKFIAGAGQIHLLGLVHGHWDLPIEFSDLEKTEAVNMGISIVIPARKILEVLFSPGLIEARTEAFNRSQG